jgi:hypothetical protein
MNRQCSINEKIDACTFVIGICEEGRTGDLEVDSRLIYISIHLTTLSVAQIIYLRMAG